MNNIKNNMKLRLGFLASHGGSNMQAIIDAIKSGSLDAVPAVVISNNSKSGALERARNEGIPCKHISLAQHPDDDAVTQDIIETLDENQVNLVILAGYMKMISPKLIEHFNGRVLNIHPALLPKFGGQGMYGMKVHEAVIEAKEALSGATVHLVSAEYDKGRILNQIEVPVLPDDTAETLAARVLEKEHIVYTDTIRKIAKNEIII